MHCAVCKNFFRKKKKIWPVNVQKYGNSVHVHIVYFYYLLSKRAQTESSTFPVCCPDGRQAVITAVTNKEKKGHQKGLGGQVHSKPCRASTIYLLLHCCHVLKMKIDDIAKCCVRFNILFVWSNTLDAPTRTGVHGAHKHARARTNTPQHSRG